MFLPNIHLGISVPSIVVIIFPLLAFITWNFHQGYCKNHVRYISKESGHMDMNKMKIEQYKMKEPACVMCEHPKGFGPSCEILS